MIHSDQIDALAVALCEAQGEFEAVAKDSANPFFKSRYAGLPAVVQAASPILVKHGLAISQLLGHDEQGDTLTTVLMHKSGQFIGDTMHLRPVKDDPQAQGSATTYGRRYSYMAALGLVADEDDDGNAGSGAKAKAARPKPARAASAQGAEEGASRPDEAGSQTRSEPASPPALPESTLAELRTLVGRAGWDTDTLRWQLVALEVEGPTRTDAQLADAVRHLSPGQAAELRANLLRNIEGSGVE